MPKKNPEEIIYGFDEETGEPKYLPRAPLMTGMEITQVPLIAPEITLLRKDIIELDPEQKEVTRLIPGVGAEDIEPLPDQDEEERPQALEEIEGDESLAIGGPGYPDLQAQLRDESMEKALNKIEGDEPLEKTTEDAKLSEGTGEVEIKVRGILEPALSIKELEKQLKQDGFTRMVTVESALVEETERKLIESLNAFVRREREIRKIINGDMVEIWIK